MPECGHSYGVYCLVWPLFCPGAMPPSDKQTLETPSGMYSMERLILGPGMTPASPPSTTLGFEAAAAAAASLQQRFSQSSASPSEVVPPSQHEQQTQPRLYLPYAPQQSNGNALTNRSNQEDVNMDERHTQKDHEFLKTFLEETMKEVVSAVGLLRYNSAPSSALAGLVAVGNDYLGQETGLTRIFHEDSVCTSAQTVSKQAHPEINRIRPLNSAGAGMSVTDQNAKVSGSGAEPEQSGLHSQHSHVEQNVNILENGSLQLLVEGHGEDRDMKNVSFSATLTRGISEPSLSASILHTGASTSVPILPLSNSFSVAGLSSQRSDDFVTSVSCVGVPSSSKGVSNLLRHSSSPAGLLSHLNDNFVDYEKVPLPCSSGNSSEDGSYERRDLMGTCLLGEGCNAAEDAMGGSPTGVSLAARKRIRELENKLLQREAPEHGLFSNHFGLPIATSAENLYPTDNLSPDNIVPCRARAKRGCATHPRSIAERVRRTKISERMKRLQELVPNMDKQTNTAEMLDEAVEYVKSLQRQVQELKENQSRCQCSCREKE